MVFWADPHFLPLRKSGGSNKSDFRILKNPIFGDSIGPGNDREAQLKVPYIIIGLAVIGGGLAAYNFLGHGGQVASLTSLANAGAPAASVASPGTSGLSDDSIINAFLEQASTDPSIGQDDDDKQCVHNAISKGPSADATFSSDQAYKAAGAEADKAQERCDTEMYARNLARLKQNTSEVIVARKSEGYFSQIVDIRMTLKAEGTQSYYRATLQNDGKNWAMTGYSQLTR
jgi:hypothetical protein